MKLLFAGGDMRFAWAARLAASRGLETATVGLEKSGFPLRQADERFIREADAVLMANPWRAAFPGPLGAGCPPAEEIMGMLKLGAALILPDDIGAPANATAHLCLSEDEDYVLANAILTAEGAMYAAMQALPCAIHDTRALVIGYGRIGERAAKLLTAFGASVTVAARREASFQPAPSSAVRSVRRTTGPSCGSLKRSRPEIPSGTPTLNTSSLEIAVSSWYNMPQTELKPPGVPYWAAFLDDTWEAAQSWPTRRQQRKKRRHPDRSV